MFTKQSNLIAPLLATLILLSGELAAETGKPPDPQAVTRGEGLYAKYCRSCHGVGGIGEPAIPWSIRLPGYFVAPALDDSQHAWHHGDEQLAQMILEGSTRSERMSAWKQLLSSQDAFDLVAYIKSLWGARALECQGPKHMSCM